MIWCCRIRNARFAASLTTAAAGIAHRSQFDCHRAPEKSLSLSQLQAATVALMLQWGSVFDPLEGLPGRDEWPNLTKLSLLHKRGHEDWTAKVGTNIALMDNKQ
jgi:hypothetical protein